MLTKHFAVVIALAVLAGSAGAAPPSKTRERVVELVTESAQHYEAGRFDQAIVLLQRAYELEKSPTILYNLARAYEGQGDLESALAAYEQYVQDDPKAKDRGAVEKRIAALREQIREREALVRERDAAAEREAAARRDAARAQKDQAKPGPPPPSEPSIVPWIVAGVGAAVIGGGAYFGLRARARHEEAQDEALARDAANRNDEAKTFALLANVAFVTGGVLVVGGVSWGIVDSSSSDTAIPAGVTLSGRF